LKLSQLYHPIRVLSSSAVAGCRMHFSTIYMQNSSSCRRPRV